MLKTLHIENIAVIECADVEFSAGLSVLTGETGAGKSIIIDSLNAVLGNRVSRELVRSGTERASVTASFESAQAERWCADNEIDTDEGEIILQRRITADGKTSGRVNGVPVTASQLRELGTLLLDIHGQNDGRQLLDERRHLDYLDAFGECGDALSSYREAYDAYRALVRETERLSMDETEKQRLEESLRYRVAELTKAELRPGEEAELMERRDLLRNSEKLTEYISSALAALYDSDSSAVAQCGDAEYNVSRASAWSADLSETEEIIRGARLAIEDASERLREKQQLLDFSPEEYDRLEERLSQLRRLEKKYSTDEEGLAALLADAERRLDELEYAGDRLAQLEKEMAKAYALAEKQAHALTDIRKAAAKRLEERVIGELRALSMPSVRFEVRLVSREGKNALSASGADEVNFAMSANAGEALGPISRIASGGELSRIMLALKNVFAEKDGVDALIFDEIDTGVSGVAAQRVAEKLASLARTKQVLCVTQLPQIAAMAQQQYLVEKSEHGGRTFTNIRLLDREGRQYELARLSGGDVITDTQLAGAEELLARDERFRASLS